MSNISISNVEHDIRFFDTGDGSQVNARDVDLSWTVASFNGGPRKPLLELDSSERALVLALRDFERSGEGFGGLCAEVESWTDEDVSSRLQISAAEVPWYRASGGIWTLLAVLNLATFLGRDVGDYVTAMLNASKAMR